jgi:hypothetical protein
MGGTLREEDRLVADEFITEGDAVGAAPQTSSAHPDAPVAEVTAPPPLQAPPARPPATAPTGPAWMGYARRFAIPALLVLALAATGTFAYLWQSAGAASNDRAALRSAGAGFSRAFLTLDSAHIDRTETAVLRLSTGAFQRVYKQGLEAGVLSALLRVAHATTTATVPDVYVGAFNARSATVITHDVVTVTAFDSKGKAQPARSVEFYIQLDLVKQGGRWLVDGVENLNFGAPAQPSASTSP